MYDKDDNTIMIIMFSKLNVKKAAILIIRYSAKKLNIKERVLRNPYRAT